MPTGAITNSIDVAQLVLYAFWIFFAGLIYYLHRENKREGYPLDSDRSQRAPRVMVQGWPKMPRSKTYLLRDGRTVTAPRVEAPAPALRARPIGRWPGAPLAPIGDPMRAEVGPGSYAQRPDILDRTVDGAPRLTPLRASPAFQVAPGDDPRGRPVYGADGQVAGVVSDLWVDQAELLFRYLEVEVTPGARHVLLPINFARIRDRRVSVRSLLAAQFNGVPALRDPNVVTMLEEEKIVAYYGAGTLYATAQRQEPLL